MTKEELINVFKFIVYKCDLIVNNDKYNPDDFTQDIVEDIGEVCNHVLDGDYGHLIEDASVNKELTWEDVQKVDSIIQQLVDENYREDEYGIPADKEFYEEVLRRFQK